MLTVTRMFAGKKGASFPDREMKRRSNDEAIRPAPVDRADGDDEREDADEGEGVGRAEPQMVAERRKSRIP